MTEETCDKGTDCCKGVCEETEINAEQEAIEMRKQEEKALMAEAVKNCCASVDPLALIAQLSLTVVQLQKDLANMEKAIGTHMAEVINHFNSQLQRMAAPRAPAQPTQLRAVPPVNGAETPATDA